MIHDPAPLQAHVSLETIPPSGSCLIGRDSLIRASVPERGTRHLRGKPGHPRMTRGRQRPTSYSLLRCRMLERDLVRSYALIGAQTRLAELDRERVDIFETFPELDPRPPAASATTPGRTRRKMSDAAKKAASIRMKKSWARRKKAQQR